MTFSPTPHDDGFGNSTDGRSSGQERPRNPSGNEAEGAPRLFRLKDLSSTGSVARPRSSDTPGSSEGSQLRSQATVSTGNEINTDRISDYTSQRGAIHAVEGNAPLANASGQVSEHDAASQSHSSAGNRPEGRLGPAGQLATYGDSGFGRPERGHLGNGDLGNGHLANGDSRASDPVSNASVPGSKQLSNPDAPAGRDWMETLSDHRNIAVLLSIAFAAAIWTGRGAQSVSDGEPAVASADTQERLVADVEKKNQADSVSTAEGDFGPELDLAASDSQDATIAELSPQSDETDLDSRTAQAVVQPVTQVNRPAIPDYSSADLAVDPSQAEGVDSRYVDSPPAMPSGKTNASLASNSNASSSAPSFDQGTPSDFVSQPVERLAMNEISLGPPTNESRVKTEQSDLTAQINSQTPNAFDVKVPSEAELEAFARQFDGNSDPATQVIGSANDTELFRRSRTPNAVGDWLKYWPLVK